MSRWYYLHKGRPFGPVTTDDLRAEIVASRLGAQDLIFKERDSSWRDIASFHEFKETLAKQQTPAAQSDEWVLLLRKEDGSGYRQQGPFRRAEIFEKLKTGEIAFTDYVWRKGLKEWYKLLALSDFHMPLSVADHILENKPQPDAQTHVIETTQTDMMDLTEVTKRIPLPQDAVVVPPSLPLNAPAGANANLAAATSFKIAPQEKLHLKLPETKPDAPTTTTQPLEASTEKTPEQRSEKTPEKADKSERVIRPGKTKKSKNLEASGQRLGVVNYYRQLTPLRKTVFVGAAIVTLSSFLFLVTYFSSYNDRKRLIIAPPTVGYVSPTPAAQAPPSIVQPPKKLVEVPVRPAEKEPEPETARIKPTYLQVAKEADGSENPRLRVMTDGSRHYPIVLSFTSEAGQLLYSRSLLRKVTLNKIADRQIDIGRLNLVPGYYDLSVETEGIKYALKISFATLSTPDFLKKLRAQRKQIFMYHNDERYSFVKTAQRLEKETYLLVQTIDNVANLNSWTQSYRSWRRNFDRVQNNTVNGISLRNRTNYVHASRWMSLKNLRSKIDRIAKDLNKMKIQGQAISSREIKDSAIELSKLKEQMIAESIWKKND